MSAKPFDLEAAKRGEPIMFRNGMSCKFGAFLEGAKPSSQLVVIYSNGEVRTRYANGMLCDSINGDDVVMAPRKRKVWLALYSDPISPENLIAAWHDSPHSVMPPWKLVHKVEVEVDE
jgi:hypothetical protein